MAARPKCWSTKLPHPIDIAKSADRGRERDYYADDDRNSAMLNDYFASIGTGTPAVDSRPPVEAPQPPAPAPQPPLNTPPPTAKTTPPEPPELSDDPYADMPEDVAWSGLSKYKPGESQLDKETVIHAAEAIVAKYEVSLESNADDDDGGADGTAEARTVITDVAFEVPAPGAEPSREPAEPYYAKPDPSLNPHPLASEAPLLAMSEVLTVSIHRNGDTLADVAKLEAVVQTLKEFEGTQTFVVLLRSSDNRTTVLDFPNDTTRDCRELRLRLIELLGPGCVA